MSSYEFGAARAGAIENGMRKALRAGRPFPLAFAAVLVASSTVMAQESGDAARGAKLARSVCSQCHEVRADRAHSPNPVAPAFANVAGWPGMTDRALRVWLQTSHPTMPNFILSRRDRDDVVAYILSLRKGGSAL